MYTNNPTHITKSNVFNKAFFETLLIALLYGIIIYYLQSFLAKASFVTQHLNETTLFHWDAGVYLNIAKNGYTYPDPKANNTGCYILFPLIWRWLHVGVKGICIINYLFFSLGFAFLTQLYKISTLEKILWLSMPAVYVMFIPYTEAIFFLLITLVFYGIKVHNKWLVWICLFLAALTKATSIFLIPAMLVMELVANTNVKWYKALYAYFINYALPLIAGIALFIWYQYHSVHIWFAYFIQQAEYEGHKYNMPKLPFSSMEGARNIWISAIAVFCCVISVIYAVTICIRWLFKNKQEPDKLLVLSLVYFAITLYKNIFYNPTWGTGSTLTIGIFRYVFATPFFYIFLHRFTHKDVPYKVTDFMLIFILCNIVWLSCGEYIHIKYFLYFNFCSLIIMLYMLLPDKKLSWPITAAIALNVLFQMLMFDQYLSGLGID